MLEKYKPNNAGDGVRQVKKKGVGDMERCVAVEDWGLIVKSECSIEYKEAVHPM